MRFCVEMVQQAEVFERLVKLRPKNLWLPYARGRNYASAGKWAEAAAKAIEQMKAAKKPTPPPVDHQKQQPVRPSP